MAEHITVEHGGSSVVNALRAKLKTVRLQLDKSNDLASIFSLFKSRSKPTEADLLVFICSVFPNDFRIPIQDLVAYGMGLDLFEDVHDMFALRCRVYDIISTIKDKKYPRKAIGGQIWPAVEKDGPLDQYVRVQRLVNLRDITKPIPWRHPLVFRQEIVEKWPRSFRYEDCYGLSLVLKKVNEHPVDLEFPNLTLLQLQYREDSQSIPNDFFGSMKELRVLTLDVPSLPHSLNVLRNLRTLRLKVPRCEDMSWVGVLINLEFLSISVLSLTEIPSELGQLENLRLLDLRKMNIAYIPPSVLSRLLKLEELYLSLSFQNWGCKAKTYDDYDEGESMEEDNSEDEAKANADCNEIDDGGRVNVSLIEIASISLNALQICVPEASLLPKKSPIFKNIREFNIFGSYNALYQPFGQYPTNVLQLTGEACDIIESGICDLFSKVGDLSLTRVRNLRSVFGQLEDNGFPQLKKMIISECNGLEYLIESPEKQFLLEGGYLFRNLECLHLSMLSNLKEIFHGRWKNLRVFSNLSQISIRFCPKLTYVFPLSIVRGLRLKSIEVLDCYGMEGIFYGNENDRILLTDSSIEKLELHSLPRLISFLAKIGVTRDSIDQRLTSDEVSVTENKDVVRHMEMYSAISSRFIVNWLQNLRSLKLAFCDTVKVVFLFEENHATSKAFNFLEVLELHGL